MPIATGIPCSWSSFHDYCLSDATETSTKPSSSWVTSGLWAAEERTGFDLDGDGKVGDPLKDLSDRVKGMLSGERKEEQDLAA